MSCLHQLCLFFAFIYWMDSTNGTPLFQGFSFQKDFEVNLKPFSFKPISFFKEKFSPFGIFGVRKGIQKRDLGAITSITAERVPLPSLAPPAPVFEHIEEEKVELTKMNRETSVIGLRPGPDPVKPLSSNLITKPSSEIGLYTAIGRNPLNNNYILQKPVQSVLEEVYGELPPRAVGPVPSQPVYFNPALPVRPIPAQPIGLYEEVPVPKGVVPLITPSPPFVLNIPLSEIPPTDGPIVRGSKLALYYGNVFLQLFSQFLTNARLRFSRPPVLVGN